MKNWAILRILVVLVLAGYLGACREAREVLFSRVSPDGSKIAYAVQVNPGGATTAFEYVVSIVDSGVDFRPSQENWSWRSYRMCPRDIVWKDSRALAVEVLQDPNYQDMIEIREHGKVRIETTFLPSGEAEAEHSERTAPS